MKEKLKNPFVQQYALEILLPIAGFFFFDWSLTIIGVFYFLDQIASDLVFTRRLKRIGKETGVSNFAALSILALIGFLLIFLIELFIFHKYWPGIISQNTPDFYAELWDFTVSELWLLFPLLILMYHLKDTFTFYMPRRYLNYNFNKALIGRLILNAGILILIFAGLLLTPQLNGLEIIALFIFIAIKLAYDFSFGKWCMKWGKIDKSVGV